MLMHSAYIRASAIVDGNNAARVLILFHQKQPASSCGLIPHDSPRQGLNFRLDEMIRDSFELRIFISIYATTCPGGIN